MKAVLYKEASGAALCEVPVPAIGEGEALIAVEACGLCGTDLMKLKAGTPGAVLGHEVAGRIAKLGRKVEGFEEGERVLVAHHVPCLECHYCRHGNVSMCRQFKSTNIDPGGFAEYVRISELHVRHTLLKIPEGLGAVAASQTEPLACCLRNARRLGLRAGDAAGVIGLGSIGLLTAQLLRRFGVSVLGLDLDEERAKAVGPWGQGFTDAALMEEALKARTRGRGLDALICTAGTAEMIGKRLEWLRDGGTLNIFASFHPPKMPLDLNQIYHRELTVMSSYSPSLEDLREALSLIASGTVQAEALKVRTFALDEFAEAVRQVRSREVMKAILAPSAKALGARHKEVSRKKEPSPLSSDRSKKLGTQMRAVIYYAPKEIRLDQVPLPEPGPGEVLVKVGAALTCGTDFKAYRQGHKVLLGDPPSPFGHELAGTVAEVGPGVLGFEPGERVVAANSAPCDRCHFCAQGQNQLCDNLKLHNGAYAEYNLVPAQIVKHNLYHLNDSLGFAEAALSEPLACAVHAVDVLGVQEGETAVIIGAGPMALLLIQALAARGSRILVLGRGPENLKLALAAGAHEVFSAKDSDPLEAVRRATEGRGADCVFEAVGSPETWEQSLALVRKGGRVCLLGGCASGTRVPIDAHRVHYGQISLHGVFHHTPKYFKAALELLSAGRVRTDLLISGRIGLAEVPSFFASRHQQSNPKVAVIP